MNGPLLGLTNFGCVIVLRNSTIANQSYENGHTQNWSRQHCFDQHRDKNSFSMYTPVSMLHEKQNYIVPA